MLSSSLSKHPTVLLLLFALPTVLSVRLPACHQIPKVLCCTERVIEKCLSGCIDYITEKCPHKLDKYEDKEERAQTTTDSRHLIDNSVTSAPSYPLKDAETRRPSRIVALPPHEQKQMIEEVEQEFRKAPQSGDYRALNPAYPLTEVTDADLTTECGVASSKPPYSPCLSRKSVDDLFLSCCHQHVPASCHSLCSFEHREHVAAELLIAAVQQDGCDLSHISKILYCANQNRDNRPCCEYLGLAGAELGVGDRCLRMCNIAHSGERVSAVEKDDLVCLSNWNVVMYCARAGLRTIN